MSTPIAPIPVVPLLAEVQKALAALSTVDPKELLSEVQLAVADANTALALVDKFAVLLPPQYQVPLKELSSVLNLVNGYVQKL